MNQVWAMSSVSIKSTYRASRPDKSSTDLCHLPHERYKLNIFRAGLVLIITVRSSSLSPICSNRLHKFLSYVLAVYIHITCVWIWYAWWDYVGLILTGDYFVFGGIYVVRHIQGGWQVWWIEFLTFPSLILPLPGCLNGACLYEGYTQPIHQPCTCGFLAILTS